VAARVTARVQHRFWHNPATISAIADTSTPGHVFVEMILNGGQKIVARITKRSCTQLGLQTGTSLWAQVKAVALLGEN
jgi:molybdate transport system ATP-binding protein